MAFLIVLVFVFLFSCGHSFDVIQYKQIKLINSNPVLVTPVTSYYCAELCYCLSICKSYNYDRKQRLCILLNSLASMNETEDNKDFIYLEKQQIPSSLGKSCKDCFKSYCIPVLFQLGKQFEQHNLNIARSNGIILEGESFSSDLSKIVAYSKASNGLTLQIVTGEIIQISIYVARPIQFDMDIRYFAKESTILYTILLNQIKLWSGKNNDQDNVIVTANVSNGRTFLGRGRYLIQMFFGTDGASVGVDLDYILIICSPLTEIIDRSACGFIVEETNVMVVQKTTDLNNVQVLKSHLIEGENFEVIPVTNKMFRSRASAEMTIYLLPGDYIKQTLCVKGTAKILIKWVSISNDGCADTMSTRLQSKEIGLIESINRQDYGRFWNEFYEVPVGNYMVLNEGESILEIMPVVIDEYGVEIDAIEIDVVTLNDGDFSVGPCG